LGLKGAAERLPEGLELPAVLELLHQIRDLKERRPAEARDQAAPTLPPDEQARLAGRAPAQDDLVVPL
jgi:hypothetical protein